MKLSRKGEYACLALISLAEHFDDTFVKIDNIARENEIPKKFLEQILLILKCAGYVKSRRGAYGGYRLGRQPEQITLAEIVRLMDGALAPVESVSTYFYESTPIEKNPKMVALLKDIRDYISGILEATSLKNLL